MHPLLTYVDHHITSYKARRTLNNFSLPHPVSPNHNLQSRYCLRYQLFDFLSRVYRNTSKPIRNESLHELTWIAFHRHLPNSPLLQLNLMGSCSFYPCPFWDNLHTHPRSAVLQMKYPSLSSSEFLRNSTYPFHHIRAVLLKFNRKYSGSLIVWDFLLQL